MQIVEVNNTHTAREFLQINRTLNKHNPCYISPLDNEVSEVFDRNKNHLYQFGECARWILVDENGNTCGRIAAFTNSKYKTRGTDVPMGGVGFFDCIQEQAAASVLFDHAKN